MKKGFTLAEVLMTKRTSGMENNILHSRESKTKEPSENIIKNCAFTLAEVLMPKRMSEIKNKIFYFRKSKGQGLLRNAIKHCAFTLAEVLITLAIIGVVAALTIPTVIENYNKHQFYTRFIKAYNTLQTAYQLSVAEHGEPSGWPIEGDDIEMFNEYFGKYLRTSKTCDDLCSECYSEDVLSSPRKNINGDYAVVQLCDGTYPVGVILQDGAFITGEVHGYYEGPEYGMVKTRYAGVFYVDTNGLDKGPNTFGRDIFLFFGSETNSKPGFAPLGTLYTAGVTTYVDHITRQEALSYCDPKSVEANGELCGARLLLEGKMTY